MTGPTAQARGAGDHAEVRGMLQSGLVLAAGIGLLLFVLQIPIAAVAFWLVDSTPEVEAYGRTYFHIRVWAIPAALATYAVIGWLYGLLDSRTPLIIQFTANGINIVLDLLFVFGFGWDVAGVAAASVIAEYSGLALGLFFVLRRLRTLPMGETRTGLFDMARLHRLVAINRDLFIRTLCVVGAFTVFIGQSAKLGELTLAANQVLHNFQQFTAFGLDGFAYAAEALVGGAYGRRDAGAFRSAVRASMLWAGIVAVLFVAVYWAAGPTIVALLTGIPEVKAEAGDYLLWVVFMPAISVWAFTLDGIYVGVSRTRVMRNTMILSFLAYLAGLWLLVPAMGNTGLWISVTAFLSARGLLLAFTYPELLRSVRR
ncbi:MAG: MATE family efflux transporter, partial [Alphaproteobacteria bacterium]